MIEPKAETSYWWQRSLPGTDALASHPQKRVLHHQPFDALAVLQVLTQQSAAAGLQCSRDNELVIKAEAPALPYLQRSLVERSRGRHLHQRQQHLPGAEGVDGFVGRA